MIIETLSVFPEMFDTVMSTSILGRAKASGLFQFHAYNLRDWTHDRHRTVDDEPYGGGQGMLMKVEPLATAIEDIASTGPRPHVVFFTPCGTPFNQQVAERLSHEERILMVCGRYEGMDERAYEYADERLSIGDYVHLVTKCRMSMNPLRRRRAAGSWNMSSTRDLQRLTAKVSPMSFFRAITRRSMRGGGRMLSSVLVVGAPILSTPPIFRLKRPVLPVSLSSDIMLFPLNSENWSHRDAA